MTQIGVYVVDSTELEKPPAERRYKRRGLYNEVQGRWTEDTDSRLQIVLPEDCETPYSIGEIQDAVESATVHVYREDEVPGFVATSQSRDHRPASD